MIVTSFSKKGYEQYGKRFLESYRKNCDIPLVVYTEDWIDEDWFDQRNLFDINGIKEFLVRTKDLDGHQGNHYKYYLNVNKFCRKVFAITDFQKDYKGKFAWLDADTYFKKKLPSGFLDQALPEGYMAILDRVYTTSKEGCNGHPECGFMVFDTNHVQNHIFMAMYINTYTSGAFTYMMTQCDSSVLGLVRLQTGVPCINLVENGNVRDDLTGDREGNPFGHSILKDYLHHMKGLEKKNAA